MQIRLTNAPDGILDYISIFVKSSFLFLTFSWKENSTHPNDGSQDEMTCRFPIGSPTSPLVHGLMDSGMGTLRSIKRVFQLDPQTSPSVLRFKRERPDLRAFARGMHPSRRSCSRASNQVVRNMEFRIF